MGLLNLHKSLQREIIQHSLGIETKQKGEAISCKIPSWRQDILGEADLSEEIKSKVKKLTNLFANNNFKM